MMICAAFSSIVNAAADAKYHEFNDIFSFVMMLKIFFFTPTCLSAEYSSRRQPMLITDALL